MENTKLSDLGKECNLYYKKRLEGLQVSEKDILITAINSEGKPQTFHLFQPEWKEDPKKTGIYIHYFDANGKVQCYAEKEKDKLKEYVRIRLLKPIEGKNYRYSQEKGSGSLPFITPKVIEKVKKKEKIETLFIVEGEFKAFAMSHHLDLDAIAIAGKDSFADKEENTLHPETLKIINECNVKRLVLLLDADCLDLTENLEKDLYIRPYGFYSAIKRFKDFTIPLNIDVYFTHIKSSYSKIAKGIDDLIVNATTDRNKLKKELLELTTGNKDYFECKNISGESINKIHKYFSLSSPKEFYKRYENIIQEQEFLWNRNRYKHDGERLKISWNGEANKFMRVGTTYYKITLEPDSRGRVSKCLQPWSAAEINRDYGNSKEFFKHIPKYDNFCNIPNNTDGYKQVVTIEQEEIVTRSYNIYSKLDHKIEPGSWENIERFLKHIGSSTNLEGVPLYEFLLDWIQICYKKPTQMLPVLCLVSTERNTGKSTFKDLLHLIFKGNAITLDNERFTGRFNSFFISKLIVSVDESFIRTDQPHIKERIKNLATGGKQMLEQKNKDAQAIDYFGKLVLCSNNERDFLQIDAGENRHCVLKIPILSSSDPDFLSKMEKEVPHFLYFLNHREYHYPEKTRSWFEFDVFKTEAMQAVQERTKNRIEREILEYITDIFQKVNVETLEFSPKDISIGLNSYLQIKTSPTSIKDHFIDMKLKQQPPKRYNLYNSEGLLVESKTGTPYLFLREDFIKHEKLF